MADSDTAGEVTSPNATLADGVFGPGDLARMGAAYRAALTIAGDESGPFGLVGGRSLRTSLARAIVDGAKRGVRDVDQLKAAALCTLAANLLLVG